MFIPIVPRPQRYLPVLELVLEQPVFVVFWPVLHETEEEKGLQLREKGIKMVTQSENGLAMVSVGPRGGVTK